MSSESCEKLCTKQPEQKDDRIYRLYASILSWSSDTKALIDYVD